MESAIATTLSKRFGDDLRSVGYYDDDGAEIEYMRDDVEANYENGDVDRVFRGAKLEALDQSHQESMYAHGDLQCTVRCFEEATELHFVQHQTKGFVVAIDAGKLTELRKTVEDCLDAIGEE